MKISVIGCGYLGAVHAACMSSLGHSVIGVETNPVRLAALTKGRAPFHEPGFDALLDEQVTAGRLTFTDALSREDAVDVDIHFLTVGTPELDESGTADLHFLWEAVESLTAHGMHRAVIVGKSTVPVGTAELVARRFSPMGMSVAWNPEFLREGYAIADTLRPDRIVYGLSEDPESAERAKRALDSAYEPILRAGAPRLVTDLATAELVKVAANSFLATKISFINAMAEICDKVGADVTVLADAIGYDPRIGRRFLNAGIGFGGGCLSKDIRAFCARAEEIGSTHSLAFLEEVDAINMRCRDRAVDLVIRMCGSDPTGARVSVLGAAFKPNSDDIRDSPAVDLANRLHRLGAVVTVTDPRALDHVRRSFPHLRVEEDEEAAVTGANIVVLATEWPQYVRADPAVLSRTVASRRILDARNVLDLQRWRDAGWDARGMGR